MHRDFLDFKVQPAFLLPRVRHLHGPLDPASLGEGVVVVCVMLNGAHYIRSFMEHYNMMGVRHFFFLDNGSTDGSLEALAIYDNVTILQTHLPYRKYENTMKRYLADRFSGGGWVICSDIDELFEYPYSDEIELATLIRYLEEHGYTAVITQMLDMFSDLPLAQLKNSPHDSIKEMYPLFDLSAIEKAPYPFDYYSRAGVDTACGDIEMHRGGVRKALFGIDPGLTKVSLFKMDGYVRPFVGWHHVRNARFADLSCVLLHFPFAGEFDEKIRDALKNHRYDGPFLEHYRAYERELACNPDFDLNISTAQHYVGMDPLIEQEFVYVSNRFKCWVQEHVENRPHSRLSGCALP